MREGTPACPRCHDGLVHRSHPRGRLDGVMIILGWYPFRCLTCWRRFRERRPPTGSLVRAARQPVAYRRERLVSRNAGEEPAQNVPRIVWLIMVITLGLALVEMVLGIR